MVAKFVLAFLEGLSCQSGPGGKNAEGCVMTQTVMEQHVKVQECFIDSGHLLGKASSLEVVSSRIRFFDPDDQVLEWFVVCCRSPMCDVQLHWILEGHDSDS